MSAQEIISRTGVTPRWNTVTDSIDFGQGLGSELLLPTLRIAGHNAGVSIPAMDEAIADAALQNPFHPVKDYLLGLKWDGRNRLSDLCNSFDQPATVARWLEGFVRRPLGDHTAFPMLIVVDKTPRLTMPLSGLFDDLSAYVCEGVPTVSNMITKWLIKYNQAITKGAAEELSELLAQYQFVYRRPYQRVAVKRPALAGVLVFYRHRPDYIPDHACVVNQIRAVSNYPADQVWAEVYSYVA